MSCMQDRERDTGVYNGLLDSEGEGEGGMIWESVSILMLTVICFNSYTLRNLKLLLFMILVI